MKQPIYYISFQKLIEFFDHVLKTGDLGHSLYYGRLSSTAELEELLTKLKVDTDGDVLVSHAMEMINALMSHKMTPYVNKGLVYRKKEITYFRHTKDHLYCKVCQKKIESPWLNKTGTCFKC